MRFLRCLRFGSRSWERAITESPRGPALTGDIDRERFLPIPQGQGPLVGWLVTLGVTAIAGVMRFWNLGWPARLTSDETYYAQWAWTQIHYGFVGSLPVNSATLVDMGTTNGIMTDKPGFPVHPPTGMWLIGASEHFVGMTPFGWRVPSAIAGTLLILVVIRLIRRITGSMFLAGVGGLFLAFDGLEFVMSRVAMLDIFVAFFVLVAALALVADRQWSRTRLLQRLDSGRSSPAWGPLLWWRPWRLAAGVSLGLAVSTKWSALFVIAVLGLMVVWWDASGRRLLRVRGAVWRSVLVDGVPAFGYLVAVAFVVYVASWIPWMVHAHEIAPALAYPIIGGSFWGDWVNVQPHGIWQNVVYAFRALWHYHVDVYRFHTVSIAGTYDIKASSAWGWPILDRPFVMYLYPLNSSGLNACAGPSCSVTALIGLGTPILWWLGVLALVDALYLMVAQRDWRFSVPILGFGATWLPWLFYGDRPIYLYYAVAIIPFTVIALVLVLGRFARVGVAPRGTDSRRRRIGKGQVAVAVVAVLVAANFVWEFPVLTAQPISRQGYVMRVFMPSWRLAELPYTSTSGGTSSGSSPGPVSTTN